MQGCSQRLRCLPFIHSYGFLEYGCVIINEFQDFQLGFPLALRLSLLFERGNLGVLLCAPIEHNGCVIRHVWLLTLLALSLMLLSLLMILVHVLARNLDW